MGPLTEAAIIPRRATHQRLISAKMVKKGITAVKYGAKQLKVVIEGAKIVKQSCEFAGFKDYATTIKVALVPLMFVRSAAFVLWDKKFTLNPYLFYNGTPEKAKNLFISILAVTTLVSPLAVAMSWATRPVMDESMMILIDVVKIYSFVELSDKEINNTNAKHPKYIRLLDIAKAVEDLTVLFFAHLLSPTVVSGLVVSSFAIGVYTFAYPCIHSVGNKALDTATKTAKFVTENAFFLVIPFTQIFLNK